MEKQKNFWSKSGIILGIILIVISILISYIAYNDPDIRHPHEFSDLKVIAYPNALLGLPAIFISSSINNIIVSPFYKIQQYSSILDDPSFQNIYDKNKKTIDDRYQAGLFITLFITLSVYWFFVGLFLFWIYNKFTKRNRIFFVIILSLIVLGSIYISLLTVTPRPFDPQTEIDKMMQGKQQVPCIGIENQNSYTKCYK